MSGLISDGTYALATKIGEVQTDGTLTGLGTLESPLGMDTAIRTAIPNSGIIANRVDNFSMGAFAVGYQVNIAGYMKANTGGTYGEAPIVSGLPASMGGAAFGGFMPDGQTLSTFMTVDTGGNLILQWRANNPSGKSGPFKLVYTMHPSAYSAIQP